MQQVTENTFFEESNFLGVVSQVSASSIKLNLLSAATRQDKNGKTGITAQVGNNVTISYQHYAILGRVDDIRLPEGHATSDFADVTPIASVSLLSTYDINTGKVSAGVVTRPGVGSRVFLSDPSFVRLIAESRKSDGGRKAGLTLDFATLSDAASTPLEVTPEMLFGRHCAIVGTSGGGKSWSVARMVEQAGKHKSKVILLDATGEYSTLTGSIVHVYLGHNPNPHEGAKEVVLPYNQLTEGDLFAIFQPTGQSQAPKLRAAIKTLKLVRLVPNLTVDGTFIKANKSKLEYESHYYKNISTLESPNADFEVRNLVRQINNECVNPNRSALEPTYWGDINGVEQALCVPLINRVQDILNSPNLAPIFQPDGKPSLIEVIDKFINHPTVRVLCISLQYLSFAHSSREIVANSVGRYLLKGAREERFKKQPLLLLVDEAHQFLNTELEDQSKRGGFPLDAFGLIAKEGRKYALNICIATQRPRDIPESVISQMGTLIVHRLINDRDRGLIERASGEMDSASLQSLPALSPGYAVLLGIEFPIPVAIKVKPPESPPNSRGPDFQTYWRHDEEETIN